MELVESKMLFSWSPKIFRIMQFRKVTLVSSLIFYLSFSSIGQDTVQVTSIPEAVEASKLGKDIVLLLAEDNSSEFPSAFFEIDKNRLISLVVDNCGYKSFPDRLADYQRIVYFRYSWFYFTDAPIHEFPSFICKLSNLRNLKFEGPKLQKLPSDFSNLASLESLSLYMNDLPLFPNEILELTQLLNLNLSCQKFTEIPENISALSNLKSLEFEGGACGATPISVIPESIGELKNLEMFTLGYTKQDIEYLPASFYNLKNLTYFQCHGCGLNGMSEQIEKLTNLEVLQLTNLENFEKLPSALFRLSKMNSFRFYQYGERANEELIDQKEIIEGWGATLESFNFDIKD